MFGECEYAGVCDTHTCPGHIAEARGQYQVSFLTIKFLNFFIIFITFYYCVCTRVCMYACVQGQVLQGQGELVTLNLFLLWVLAAGLLGTRTHACSVLGINEGQGSRFCDSWVKGRASHCENMGEGHVQRPHARAWGAGQRQMAFYPRKAQSRISELPIMLIGWTASLSQLLSKSWLLC